MADASNIPAAARTIRRERLPCDVPGTERALTIVRYGKAGARPKAYLQAGLHADEVPGMLVLHHLIERLDRLAAAGRVVGEVVVVPAANPIGLSQWLGLWQLGRFEMAAGSNFNREFPSLGEAVVARVADKLRHDPAADLAAVRQAIAFELMARQPDSEVMALRLALLRHAADADFALDLHCDHEALPHLYVNVEGSLLVTDLAARLGCGAVLYTQHSGSVPFDDACAAPWHALRAAGADILVGCLSATIELRGVADVEDSLAAADAAALLEFLAAAGVLDGTAPPPPRLVSRVTPLSGVDVIRAPCGGVVVFTKPVGATVAVHEVVAEIVDPFLAGPAAARTPVRSQTSGILFARGLPRFARAGQVVAKVAGALPLPERTGDLLVD